MSKKKILMLGGSAQQVIAIKTAKQLGYYTVLCDYLPDNPGQYEADKFYATSTTDIEAVYEIANAQNSQDIENAFYDFGGATSTIGLSIVGAKPSLKQAGIAYAMGQVVDLIANGFKNVHIYTMNKPDIVGSIVKNLSALLK